MGALLVFDAYRSVGVCDVAWLCYTLTPCCAKLCNIPPLSSWHFTQRGFRLLHSLGIVVM